MTFCSSLPRAQRVRAQHPPPGGTEGTTGADQNTAEEKNEAVNPAAAGQDIYAEFDALVGKGGKYADAYARKMQSGFDKRYKEFKATEEREQRLSRFRDTVAGDYAGVNPDDIDALEEAYLKTSAALHSARSKPGNRQKSSPTTTICPAN